MRGRAAERESGRLIVVVERAGRHPSRAVAKTDNRQQTTDNPSPDGGQIRSPDEHFALPQFVTVAEAQRRAAFTVLTLGRLPTDWRRRPYCGYADASSWSSAKVILHYRTDTGGQRVSIVQMAAADAPQHYGMIFDDECWHEVLRDGTPIKIRQAGESLQARAHLTRNGTFAYLTSDNLTTGELETIAASLRPAPETDSA
jgi:hypothetical protein